MKLTRQHFLRSFDGYVFPKKWKDILVFNGFFQLKYSKGSPKRTFPLSGAYLFLYIFASLLIVLSFLGCQKRGLHGWIFYKGYLRYKIGALDSSWRPIKLAENDIAFYNKTYAALIQVNSTCRKDYEDVSLKILTDHLFYGLQDRKLILQEKRRVARRAALYTEMEASLDGVRVKTAVLVLKKNECIYDFTYLTRPWNFSRGINSFHRVIYGFKVLEQ